MARIANQAYKMLRLEEIAPHPQNPNQGDVGAISKSIESNDFFGAIVVQKSTGRIIAGEHRWRAAKANGLTEVPVILADVDDERALRMLVASNQIARRATWDEGGLAELLSGLAIGEDELAGTGFERAELDDLLRRSGELAGRATGFLDDFLNPSHGPADEPSSAGSPGSADPNQMPPGSHQDGGGVPAPGPDGGTASTDGSTAPHPPGATDFVQVAWTVHVHERERLREGLRIAQARWELDTSWAALLAIVQDFLTRQAG